MALTIGVLVMTGVARMSQSQVMQVRRESSEIQWRWGNLSCQESILGNAKQLLTSKDGRILPEREFRFELGGQYVFLRLADDNQKLDLNLLSMRLEDKELKDLIQKESFCQLPVDLRALPPRLQRNLNEGSFESWNQIWKATAPGDSQQLLIGARGLTLWGNRLNIRLAADEKIRIMAQPFIGSISTTKLLKARASLSQNADLEDIIAVAALNPRDSALCKQLFCDESASFSMWVTMVDGKRERTSLTVREGVPVNGSKRIIERMHTFQW